MARIELGGAGDDAPAVHPSSDGHHRWNIPVVGGGVVVVLGLDHSGCPWPLVVCVLIVVLWFDDRRHGRAARLAGRPQDSRDRLLLDLAQAGGLRDVLRILGRGSEATRRRGRR